MRLSVRPAFVRGSWEIRTPFDWWGAKRKG
jgi:hypothetical protein